MSPGCVSRTSTQPKDTEEDGLKKPDVVFFFYFVNIYGFISTYIYREAAVINEQQ